MNELKNKVIALIAADIAAGKIPHMMGAMLIRYVTRIEVEHE